MIGGHTALQSGAEGRELLAHRAEVEFLVVRPAGCDLRGTLGEGQTRTFYTVFATSCEPIIISG